MPENKLLGAAFLISFTGHCLFLGASGFSFHAPRQEKHPEELAVELEIERPALLPKIETLGEEKKFKENKREPKQLKTQVQPAPPEEAIIQPALEERAEEKVETINPEEEAMLRYQDMVKQKIEEARSYPLWAKKQGIEGSAYLYFTVLPDGQSRNIRLARSCGSGVLDEEAIATVKRAGPFPAFAKKINSPYIDMQVAIVFSLGKD